MGGFGSSRWQNHNKKLCVEQCERIRAHICPLCQRAVKWVYIAPVSILWSGQIHNVGPGCRLCLGLTYFAQQSKGTLSAKLANDPIRCSALFKDALELLSNAAPYSSEPPLQIQKQGRRAVGHWFRNRDSSLNTAIHILAALNRVPSTW